MLAEDATSCQWKLISGGCGLLPPWAPALGRRLVGAGAPAAPGAPVTSAAPLQSHLMCGGLPQDSRCRGRGSWVPAGCEERLGEGDPGLSPSPASPPERPLVLQPTSISLPSFLLQRLQSFLHILCSGWNSVCHFLAGGFQFHVLVCKLEIIIAPSSQGGYEGWSELPPET